MVELQRVDAPRVRRVVLHELAGAHVPHADGAVQAGRRHAAGAPVRAGRLSDEFRNEPAVENIQRKGMRLLTLPRGGHRRR